MNVIEVNAPINFGHQKLYYVYWYS